MSRVPVLGCGLDGIVDGIAELVLTLGSSVPQWSSENGEPPSKYVRRPDGLGAVHWWRNLDSNLRFSGPIPQTF
ncbi:hypothetical protein AAFP32_05280 [Brevibacterium sp. CBA3109]|uniref:Uncharacterized protein n=1 Tax=Brevibacterium koreense TaxID=3140787 RepID=A0AAU7UMT8_9MICO